MAPLTVAGGGRRIALPDGPGDVAPASDVPVGVTHRSHPSGPDPPAGCRSAPGDPGAPVTGALRVIVGAARPGLRRRTGTGLAASDLAPRRHRPTAAPADASPTKIRLISLCIRASRAGSARMGQVTLFADDRRHGGPSALRAEPATIRVASTSLGWSSMSDHGTFRESRVWPPRPSTPVTGPTRRPARSIPRSTPAAPSLRTASAVCAADSSTPAPATRPGPRWKARWPPSRRAASAGHSAPAWRPATARCARCCGPAITWSSPTTPTAARSG